MEEWICFLVRCKRLNPRLQRQQLFPRAELEHQLRDLLPRRPHLQGHPGAPLHAQGGGRATEQRDVFAARIASCNVLVPPSVTGGTALRCKYRVARVVRDEVLFNGLLYVCSTPSLTVSALRSFLQ